MCVNIWFEVRSLCGLGDLFWLPMTLKGFCLGIGKRKRGMVFWGNARIDTRAIIINRYIVRPGDDSTIKIR